MFPIIKIPGILANFRLASGTKTSENLKKFGPELLCIYRRFFSDPALPLEIKTLESRVLSRVHWRTGVELCAAGDWQQGRLHCAEAVGDPCNVFDDGDFAIDRLIHSPDARQNALRNRLVIQRVLTELPLPTIAKVRVRHRVWARHTAARFFLAHVNAQWHEVRCSGLAALLLNPTWFRNRGFVSILARALLGPEIMTVLRPRKRILSEDRCPL